MQHTGTEILLTMLEGCQMAQQATSSSHLPETGRPRDKDRTGQPRDKDCTNVERTNISNWYAATPHKLC